MKDPELFMLFRDNHIQVRWAQVVRHMDGKSKGFGVISVPRGEQIMAMRTLNGTNLLGRTITIKIYRPPRNIRLSENEKCIILALRSASVFGWCPVCNNHISQVAYCTGVYGSNCNA